MGAASGEIVSALLDDFQQSRLLRLAANSIVIGLKPLRAARMDRAGIEGRPIPVR